MISIFCVRCGKPATDIDLANRLCAPCCDACKADVVKEVKKNYSTWPADWRGGWSWGKGHWNAVRRMDGTGQ